MVVRQPAVTADIPQAVPEPKVASGPTVMPEPRVIAEPRVVPEPKVVPEPMVVLEPKMMPEPRAVLERAAPASAERAGTMPPSAYAQITPPPVIPRRPVLEDSGRSDVPWLGIGSWLLLCGALFASLVGWPSQTSLDRVSQLWSDSVPTTETAAGLQDLPHGSQTWTALPDTGGDPKSLPPTELAPPIAPRTLERIPGGPPLPQFKPIVDGVAAKYTNASTETAERLQPVGETDAAHEMRRQGNQLDPWRAPNGSEL
jgi:hypothetical protein